MGRSTETRTCISIYIENLSECAEVKWEHLDNLVEALHMNPAGDKEAVETIYKTIRHRFFINERKTLNTLLVLKLLMEHLDQRFRSEVVYNYKLMGCLQGLIEVYKSSYSVVKKELVLVFCTAIKFVDVEPHLDLFHTLHVDATLNVNMSRLLGAPTPLNCADANEQYVAKEIIPRLITAGSDLEEIIQLATKAALSANNLLKALQSVDISNKEWCVTMQNDAIIKHLFNICSDEQKKIDIRLTRPIEDKRWEIKLKDANENSLMALRMYRAMLRGDIPFDLPTYEESVEPSWLENAFFNAVIEQRERRR